MKKTIKEQTVFVEAYKCSNSHIFPKYKPGAFNTPMNSLLFHNCCSKCGSTEIQTITGKWEEEYIITGLIFKKKRLVKKEFIESKKIKENMSSMEDIIQNLIKDGGFTEKEAECLYHITQAWNIYVKLEKQHPSELGEFSDSIHRLQYLLGIRVLRRTFPKAWYNHTNIHKKEA